MPAFRGILKREGVLRLKLDYRKNLGDLDRVIRTAIGLFLLLLVLSGKATGWLAVVAVVFAVFQFVEAVLAY